MIHNIKTKKRRSVIFTALMCSAIISSPLCANEGEGDSRYVSGRLISYTTPVGAQEVDRTSIKPYAARWTSPGGVFEETLVAIDDQTWEHTQIQYQGSGDDAVKIATETRELSRRDLRSLSWARKHHIESPNLPFKSVTTEVTAGELVGEMINNDGEKAPFNASLPMPVFDGWIAGIVIAALPLEEGYWASLPTATYIFKGVHHITVRVTGRELIETPQGEEIDTWVVGAEWVDLGNGDIYDPGATGTGGVYNIAVKPGKGVPYVVKYEAQSNPIIWDGVRLAAP